VAVFGTLTLQEVKEKFTGFSAVWAPVLRPSELHTHPPGRRQRLPPAVTAHDGCDYRIVAAPGHFSGRTTKPPGPAL
jgi:crotonobetainyl-CoA:carnitine CoA-transferase CaiB-like acyl-CoA transferase